MAEYPDRPPAYETSPFAWVWDDLVPRPHSTGYVLRCEDGICYYAMKVETNRGRIGILVGEDNPPSWRPYPTVWPTESDLLQIAISIRDAPFRFR